MISTFFFMVEFDRSYKKIKRRKRKQNISLIP